MVYIVTGFPRSGTTAMMGALIAGGLEPYEEVEELHETWDVLRLRAGDSRWMKECEGKCVKIPTMHVYKPPDGMYTTIVMARDPLRNAQSQIRWMKHNRMANLPDSQIAYLSQMLNKTWRDMWDAAEEVSYLTMRVSFEGMIKDPLMVMGRLAEYGGMPIDPEKAAATIHKRTTGLRPEILEKQFDGTRKLDA